ncbi:MAG: hypothetical protein U5L95_05325 [Candidatus Saccharibacteria bacterium]|nr:hypothetical protein [Candidatus Saccharibacteria bacterium]
MLEIERKGYSIMADNTIDRSLEFYQDQMGKLNEGHPQFQGFTEEEFRVACEAERTVCSEVEADIGNIVLPSIVEVKQFGWLKTSYYEETFSEAAANESLMHYHETPGVDPGDSVRQAISSIAEKNGVLTYDFPSTDGTYPQRVHDLITSSGAETAKEFELANQTYFIGHVALKDQAKKREVPVQFSEAFELAVSDGTYGDERFKNGASLHTVIDPKKAAEMYNFYKDAYRKLEQEPCEQGLSPEEFYKMMTQNENVIKVVNSVDGEIVSLCLLENDLSELSWVNEIYYAKNYPEKYKKGQLYWFPGLAANPNKKGGFNTQIMVDLIAELVEKGGNEISVAFDCGKTNTGFLDVFLNKMINDTPQASIDIQPIAQQAYRAVQLNK